MWEQVALTRTCSGSSYTRLRVQAGPGPYALSLGLEKQGPREQGKTVLRLLAAGLQTLLLWLKNSIGLGEDCDQKLKPAPHEAGSRRRPLSRVVLIFQEREEVTVGASVWGLGIYSNNPMTPGQAGMSESGSCVPRNRWVYWREVAGQTVLLDGWALT